MQYFSQVWWKIPIRTSLKTVPRVFPLFRHFSFPEYQTKTHFLRAAGQKKNSWGPRSRPVQNQAHQLVALWTVLGFSKVRLGEDPGGKDSNLRGRGAWLLREPAWGLRAGKAWPAHTRQEEKVRIAGGNESASTAASPGNQPIARPLPAGAARGLSSRGGAERWRHPAGFFFFGAPVPQAPPPPIPVGLLVLLNVHLHRISYSKCLPVCRLKALTQGPSSSPGARSELKIRVRVSGSRSRQYHGQLQF